MRIKYICISKNSSSEDAAGIGHVVRVGLSGVPSESWMQFFLYNCRRGTFIRKNKICINRNELMMKVENGISIQEYIETIKLIVASANVSFGNYSTNFNFKKVTGIMT